MNSIQDVQKLKVLVMEMEIFITSASTSPSAMEQAEKTYKKLCERFKQISGALPADLADRCVSVIEKFNKFSPGAADVAAASMGMQPSSKPITPSVGVPQYAFGARSWAPAEKAEPARPTKTKAEAVRAVCSALGPNGDQIAIAIEKATNKQQLAAALEKAASTISAFSGSEKAAQFKSTFSVMSI